MNMRKNVDHLYQIKEAYSEFIGWTDNSFEQELEARFVYSKEHRDEITLFREEIRIDDITPIDNCWCELCWHRVNSENKKEQKSKYFLMPRYFIGKKVFSEGYSYKANPMQSEILFLYYQVFDIEAFPERNENNYAQSGIFGFFKIKDIIQRPETQLLTGFSKKGEIQVNALLAGGKIIDLQNFIGKRYVWDAMRFDMRKDIPENRQNWYIKKLYINLDLQLMKKASELFSYEELNEFLIEKSNSYDVLENIQEDEERSY